MKKILLLIAVLCTVQIANAQKVFSLHAVKIEGDLKAFEKVETELNAKAAQEAVNKGDILYWGLFKIQQFNQLDIPGDYNYVFVQWANNIDDLLSTKSAWWNNANKVLTQSEIEQSKTLSASFKWTKDMRNLFVVDDEAYDQGNAEYFQFNFGRPVNTGGFIAENKALWKPFFVKNMNKMNMKVWGVGRRLTFPTMDSSHNTIMSWDGFASLEDIMKFRIGGAPLPGYAEVMQKTKMASYIPDGFTYSPIFKVLKATSSK
jgi:hypothetical protein